MLEFDQDRTKTISQFWSVPKCDRCVLICLKNDTKGENTTGYTSNKLSPAYVKGSEIFDVSKAALPVSIMLNEFSQNIEEGRWV